MPEHPTLAKEKKVMETQTITFVKAERKRSKLRLALAGVSGSGKTMSALKVANGINQKIVGKIAVIDTERGSASLYDNVCEFDTLSLEPPYTPERYIQAIKVAEMAGYSILIIDSLTHEWNGSGGILESNEILSKTKFKGNGWAAWSESTPRHMALINAILQSSMHVIVTMRSKSSYVESERNGKKSIVKQGTEPQQRDGMEFEFTTFLEIAKDGHYAMVDNGKDRTQLFTEPMVLSEKTGEMLIEWLLSGKKSDAEIEMEKRAELRIELSKVLKEMGGTEEWVIGQFGDLVQMSLKKMESIIKQLKEMKEKRDKEKKDAEAEKGKAADENKTPAPAVEGAVKDAEIITEVA